MWRQSAPLIASAHAGASMWECYSSDSQPRARHVTQSPHTQAMNVLFGKYVDECLLACEVMPIMMQACSVFTPLPQWAVLTRKACRWGSMNPRKVRSCATEFLFGRGSHTERVPAGNLYWRRCRPQRHMPSCSTVSDKHPQRDKSNSRC